MPGNPGAGDTGSGPRIKRIYEPRTPDDGVRVLVDRLWPRGISKARAGLDLWLKDAAPSAALRDWFGHRPERWAEFQRRYREELRDSAALEQLREISRTQRVTLLYAARDEEHNEAAALADFLLHDSA
jgi:uncharacterized protein YeaO (DUF488 family)